MTQVDSLHVQIVDTALNSGTEEYEVKMTFGELILYHCLLQDYGIDLAGTERFVALLERNKKRIEAYPHGSQEEPT